MKTSRPSVHRPRSRFLASCRRHRSRRFSRVPGGMGYYGYRYMSPELGRWLSCDPLPEDEVGPNRHAFVHNDPLVGIDPMGLKEGCCCCCADKLSFARLVPDRTWDPERWSGTGWRGIMSFNFRFAIQLSYPALSEGDTPGDCSLEYRERERIDRGRWGTWHDSHLNHPTYATFDEWESRPRPCYTVDQLSLYDHPAVWAVDYGTGWIRPGAPPLERRTITRQLEITVVVKSAPNCFCPNKALIRTVSMTQRLVNGVPDWVNSVAPE